MVPGKFNPQQVAYVHALKVGKGGVGVVMQKFSLKAVLIHPFDESHNGGDCGWDVVFDLGKIETYRFVRRQLGQFCEKSGQAFLKNILGHEEDRHPAASTIRILSSWMTSR
jgi:hypothetical protein